MNHPILSENQKKRLDMPLSMLICFAMFNFWQMGFIYFIGPSLTIDGKTPLPIDIDNATTLIALCYVLSICWMIFLPKTVIWTQRIATGISLLSAVGLFLPLSDAALRFLVHTQIFCCCLMIGFETFIMVNFFSEKSNTMHLTVAYGISLLLIAFIRNEIIPITFSAFRIIMLIAIALLLVFFIRMPAKSDALPQYVSKKGGLTAPKGLLWGTYILVFVCALMGVSGPAISEGIKHGVFIAYSVDAIASFVLYLLYKKANIHPFKLTPVLTGLGCIGFLLMFATTYVPALAYVSCGLIGFAMISCQMLPLYGMVMMKSYPSKYISPIIIGLALVAVLVQGSMVEIFRSTPTMLYLVYAVIMVILVITYMQLEPFLLFTLRRRIADDTHFEEATVAEASSAYPLAVLSPKEREVAELICLGYTNRDIAKMMFISEHTVKDHTKKIYPKVGVHSRMELAALIGKWNASE